MPICIVLSREFVGGRPNHLNYPFWQVLSMLDAENLGVRSLNLAQKVYWHIFLSFKENPG